MLEAVDCPKSLKSLAERNARLLRVEEPHVSALTHYVREIREATGLGEQNPFSDPLDGGVDASCLYLLEASGAHARSSGFISRNNPDESAKNFFELNQEAGIPRAVTVIWNIVPWYIGPDEKIRPARHADLAAGLPHLQRVLELLPELRIVVFIGKKSTFAEKHIRAARPDPGTATTYSSCSCTAQACCNAIARICNSSASAMKSCGPD